MKLIYYTPLKNRYLILATLDDLCSLLQRGYTIRPYPKNKPATIRDNYDRPDLNVLGDPLTAAEIRQQDAIMRRIHGDYYARIVNFTGHYLYDSKQQLVGVIAEPSIIGKTPPDYTTISNSMQCYSIGLHWDEKPLPSGVPALVQLAEVEQCAPKN